MQRGNWFLTGRKSTRRRRRRCRRRRLIVVDLLVRTSPCFEDLSFLLLDQLWLDGFIIRQRVDDDLLFIQLQYTVYNNNNNSDNNVETEKRIHTMQRDQR